MLDRTEEGENQLESRVSVRPDLTASEVEEILKRSAVDLSVTHPELKGQLGAGRIDALAAVRAAKAFKKASI